MKAKFSNSNFILFVFLLSLPVILSGCDSIDNEINFIGTAAMEGMIQYQDPISGSVKNAPKGTSFQVYIENQSTPFYIGQTSQNGYWSFAPPAIGSYTFEFSRKDTLLQFLSKLVKKEDLDTTRSNEYIILDYKASSIFSVIRDEQKENDILLLFDGTGLRLTVKDENGQPIKGAALCVYSNEIFYTANFPNCGGSLKYIETDENGSALFLGLLPNTTYYINGRTKVGVVEISNHEDLNTQKFNTGNSGQIVDRNLILK